MAIVRTAKGTAVASGTTSIASVAMSTGDLLVVGIAQNSTAGDKITSVTWGGETLNQDVVLYDGTRTVVSIYSKIITTGGTQTITSTKSDSSKQAIFATKFTGIASASFLDQIQSNSGSGTSPSSGATPTTTQADELLLGCIDLSTNVAVGGTWSNSFNDGQSANTTGGSAGGNASVNEGYLVVSATGAYTAAKTGTASAAWAAAIATYEAQVAAGVFEDDSIVLPGKQPIDPVVTVFA